MNDTIAAIATPPGRGAIGIVRMSGKGSPEVLKRVWTSRVCPVDKFVTHRLYLGNIIDLSTGKVIDTVLASLMKGPNSYTGENIIEVSCHGGTVVLRMILDQLLKAGARPAEPGEFTKRSFLNGKIDLAQAEAVALLIDSKSETAARFAGEQLEGKLSEKIGEVSGRLKRLLAYVEATIDFPEEEEKFIDEGEVNEKIQSISGELEILINSYDQGRIYREGVKTVIAGPPNAGKSSLLNALLGSPRAIVHHSPGTTRDTIEEEMLISGVSLRMIDTAGIRDAEAEVEEIGVERSRKEAASAEIVLLVLDGHDFVSPEEKFIRELEGVQHVVVVLNKKDLGIKIQKDTIEKLIGKRPVYEISAQLGEGVKELSNAIVGEILRKDVTMESEGFIVTNKRHFILLKNAQESFSEAKKCVDTKASTEFVAHHLRRALDFLGGIVGSVTTDDILDEIFKNFCIGK